jgi:hypothetical protein
MKFFYIGGKHVKAMTKLVMEKLFKDEILNTPAKKEKKGFKFGLLFCNFW